MNPAETNLVGMRGERRSGTDRRQGGDRRQADRRQTKQPGWLRRLRPNLRVPFALTMLSGLASFAVGVLGMVMIASVDGPSSRMSSALMRGSADLILIGVLLLIYASLRRKGRSIEEAYRLGYDIGFDNGYRAGREAREPVAPPQHPAVDEVAPASVVPLRKRGR